MATLVGQSVDRYHILEQLGEGGMATVYKAYDTRLDRNVAVKFIRTDNLMADMLEQSLKRFEREARALGKLAHPNIVSVSDYGQYNGKPYLVMEYLPGGTLKQKLGKPMPWQEAFQLILPIAEALDYAHSQNMIHRDVKPSNILLTQRGQPMLTDFGIAKILDLNGTVELTGTSMAVGTPEYMAPEQVFAKTVDARADVYSLGIVIYEMVTGRTPFVADTPMALLIKHANDPLPSPRNFAPDLPEGVERILLKALEKEREYRFQSMEEFVSAMKALLAEKLASAPTPDPMPAPPQVQATRTIYEPPRPVVQPGPTMIENIPMGYEYEEKKPPQRRSLLRWALIAGIVLCVIGTVGVVSLGVILSNVVIVTASPPGPLFTPTPPPTVTPLPSASPVPMPAIGLFPDADSVWNDWNNQRITTLRSLVAEEWDLDAGILAGQEYFRFTASVSQSQSVLWEIGWCAVDEATLKQNISQMGFELSVNEQPVPSSAIAEKYYTDNRNLNCYVQFAVMKDWPLGTHIVRTVEAFHADTNDGTAVYPAGRKVIEIFVTVSP